MIPRWTPTRRALVLSGLGPIPQASSMTLSWALAAMVLW